MFRIDIQIVLHEIFEVVFIVGETIICLSGEINDSFVSLEHNFWMSFEFLEVLIKKRSKYIKQYELKVYVKQIF